MTTVADILRGLGGAPDAAGAQDVDTPVTEPASLGAAGPGSVTFCTAAARGGAEAVRASRAALVIVDEPVAVDGAAAVVVRSANARLDFARVVAAHFAPPAPEPGVHPSAVVDPEATLGDGVHVGAGCTIAGAVTIGDGTVLHPGVHVLRGVRIGPRVTVFPGTVIGADGYGFERDEQGELVRFPHVGGVTIEEGVEIGANACIDRGALDDTCIGPNVRIDNLVHIAHNARIGRDAAVIAHAMVAGSCRIGERAWIAPCACIREGVQVGDDAVVGLGAVVTADVPAGTTVLGNPGRDLSTHRAIQARLKALAGA